MQNNIARPSLLLSLVCAAVLSACQINPATHSVAVQEPDVVQSTFTAVNYQQFFTDPALKAYLRTALAHNHDVAIAQLNLAKVKTLYQLEQAAQVPQLNVSGNQQRIGRSQSQGGGITQQTDLSVGFSAFELDFFGKQANLTQQALAQFYATEQALQVTQLQVITQVANAYVLVRTSEQQVTIAQETLNNQQATLALITKQWQLGAASELTLAQAKAQVATVRADHIRGQRQLTLAQQALAILLGGAALPPATTPWSAELMHAALPQFADGLPASLLQQRPDLRQTELQLQAAEANIAHARAAFFPSIRLTTQVGSASQDLDGLFDSGSGAWVFNPSLQLPIFDGGKNQAQLQQTQIDRDIVLQNYQQSIRQAFREVRDAITERSSYQQQLQAQTELLEQLATSYHLANARYQAGAESYLQVLDAQRSWYNGKQQLIALQQANLSADISLFKALGGGMTP